MERQVLQQPIARRQREAITGKVAVNGWHFFLVDPKKKRLLNDVRIDYSGAIAADPEDDDE